MIGCTAVVALIVILSIMVSQILLAYDFNTIMSCMFWWSNVARRTYDNGWSLIGIFLCVRYEKVTLRWKGSEGYQH